MQKSQNLIKKLSTSSIYISETLIQTLLELAGETAEYE